MGQHHQRFGEGGVVLDRQDQAPGALATTAVIGHIGDGRRCRRGDRRRGNRACGDRCRRLRRSRDGYRRRRFTRCRDRRALQRQFQDEAAAAARLAVDVDAAAHALGKGARDRQAQAGALRAAGLGAVERLERPRQRLGGHADAGVAHHHPVVEHMHVDAPFVGVAAGVAHQVADHHLQHPWRRVQLHRAIAVQVHRHRARYQQLVGVVHFIADDVVDIEQLDLRLDIGLAGQDQERIDHRFHVTAGALDALQALQHLLIQAGAGQQQLGGATDHRQRRAQFMADVSIELAVALHHLGQPRRRGARGSGSLVPPR
ncbi:hypothetical protein G6F32_013590 [Rhizopus arrhizus]|nr:hypothetical protein G6F32_013590 [Rhizopus arrhizus]